MGLSSAGIGSGLDVDGLVSKLMAVESQPLTTLNKKESSYLAQVSAYGTLNSALSTFQGALSGLTAADKFQGVSLTPGDSAIVSGSASAKAVPGSYTVDITKLAQSQSLATAGKSSTTDPIGDGKKTTLTFEFGTISGGKLLNGKYVTDAGATKPAPEFVQDANQASGTIVIDSTNNSLQGIRDAINKANIGVTATIVSDGSANPNHLVLTSTKTGETSSMRISVARDPADPVDTSLSDLLAYDAAGAQNLNQNIAAQSTELNVNGIAIKSSTKSISDAIQGVTLTASKIGSTTVTVAKDTASVQSSIKNFVKAYNDLDASIKSLTSYNAETKKGGPLLGDGTVRSIQNQIRSMLGAKLGVNAGSLSSLGQIGISFQKDGTMALDTTKLQNALNNNVDDVAGLFASMGKASDSLVRYVSSTSATKAGSGVVNITALATQGKLSATSAPASLTVTAGVNDQLNLNVDGVSANLTLAPNTYTQASLVSQLQSAINGISAFSSAGISVTVSADSDGKISITSNRYGSASKVTASGTAADNLLPSANTTTGTDVAGTINGSAAIGSGQFLTGAKGSTADGLKLEITGGPTGDRGTVSFSQGYAYQLGKLLDNFLGSDGLIHDKTDGLNRTVKEIGKSRDALNVRLAATEKRLRAQFTALDTSLSSMQSTSTYLTQQLAALSANT